MEMDMVNSREDIDEMDGQSVGEQTIHGNADHGQPDQGFSEHGQPVSGQSEHGQPVLVQETDGLTLTDGHLTLKGDFRTMLPRLTHANLTHELLVKAAKIRDLGPNPTAIDATAGMGEDSLLLAAAGYQVRMYEYNPVTAALLRDTLARAAKDPDLAPYAARMTLIEGDSRLALESLTAPPDLILLDPMFPARQKSGLIKKKLQLLQQLEKPCPEPDQEALLSAAIKAGPRRIVIKRPAKGPYLAGIKPGYSIDGKTIRYDVIVLR